MPENRLPMQEIKGGSIPKEYIPGVLKGLQDSMSTGTLAGFPVVGACRFLTVCIRGLCGCLTVNLLFN